MKSIFLCFAILNTCIASHYGSLNDPEMSLAEMYISQGEDLLLDGEYESSIEDLLTGYQIACIELQDTQIQLRALFPLMIAYGHLNRQNSLQHVVNEMSFAIQNCSCNTTPEKPILGPDRISIEDCIERVNGVTYAATALCVAIPNRAAQASAIVAIQMLGDRAKSCCEAGGLWKGCLRPLVNK